MDQGCFIAIDLKSFYASVECVDRGLDPLTARLVVADPTRTDKTICLAVSPALKAYGIAGRARLFEVIQRVKQLNKAGEHIDYIVAPPRMGRYMEVSSEIFSIYLRYVASEDMHVYSVDEVFIDASAYLKKYACTPHELAIRMIHEVLEQTGITATAGIGTNMYLAKIAMDIEAKHCEADKDGVRIAELDEMSYRRKYWDHRPLTDFWRVGRGLAAKLEANMMYTMGDVARMSLQCEELLYKLFGVNAELLIDHAWGWEPCTMAQIKAYRPSSSSLSSGQVLSTPYSFRKARVVAMEMIDALSLDLVEKRLLASQLVLTVCYDSENVSKEGYTGPVCSDHYGKSVPKPAHGSANLPVQSSSSELLDETLMALFDRIVDPKLTVRRLNVVAAGLVREDEAAPVQLDLFEEKVDPELAERERRRQEAILSIKHKYGKNAILKGTSFEEGATAIERNAQVGGHKA